MAEADPPKEEQEDNLPTPEERAPQTPAEAEAEEPQPSEPEELDLSDTAPLTGPTEKDIKNKILDEDAEFRRRFASNMLGLVTAILIVTLAGHLVASLIALQTPDSAFAEAVVASLKEIFPIAFSGVMGIFGTVVGFYFASGGKE